MLCLGPTSVRGTRPPPSASTIWGVIIFLKNQINFAALWPSQGARGHRHGAEGASPCPLCAHNDPEGLSDQHRFISSQHFF